MEQITLSVEGMAGDHCVRTISGALADVPEVRTLAVDLAAGTVRVTGAVDEAEVRAAIVAAGYSVAP
jgi:copper chaperone